MDEGKQKALEEIRAIYQDVSEWLKFAEAKHAGLFAIWLAVWGTIYSNEGVLAQKQCWYIGVLFSILIVALINLWSFIPFLNRSDYLKKCCYHRYKGYSANRVFYQSIFVNTYADDINISINKYKQLFMQDFNSDDSSRLLDDYIRQIIEVSTVGTIKVYMFAISAAASVVVFILLCIGLILK